MRTAASCSTRRRTPAEEVNRNRNGPIAMTYYSPPSERISLGFVAFSFVLSGMAGGLAASLGLKSRGGLPAVVLVAIVFLIAHTLAASSLRIHWLGRFGVGFANCLGMIGSFPPFIGTQAMKGNETFADLFVPFAVWFVGAFLIASAFGLSTLQKYGWTVMGLGILGHCAGAAANGGLVALSYSLTFAGKPIGTVLFVPYFVLPGLFGGIGLAIALNYKPRSSS